jgi:hypothetical protein
MSGSSCPTCSTADPVLLFSDIFLPARSVRAPDHYETADATLSLAILVEFFFLVCTTFFGITPVALLLMALLGTTAISLAWVLPTLRHASRHRLVRAARRRVLPRARWSPRLPPAPVTVAGTARRLERVTQAPLSGQPCLAATADVVVDQRLAAREVTAEQFLVVDDFGVPTVVCGTIWFEPPAYDFALPTEWARLSTPAADQPMLPARFEPAARACEARIREGDRISATGTISVEPHAAIFAGYRDPGRVRVMRGTPGAPVVLRRE